MQFIFPTTTKRRMGYDYTRTTMLPVNWYFGKSKAFTGKSGQWRVKFLGNWFSRSDSQYRQIPSDELIVNKKINLCNISRNRYSHRVFCSLFNLNRYLKIQKYVSNYGKFQGYVQSFNYVIRISCWMFSSVPYDPYMIDIDM